MKNMKDFKAFNESSEIMNNFIPATTEETLTDYYKCNNCGNLFKMFNEVATNCKSCRSNDILNISDFDYMGELKKIGDKKEFEKEIKNKKEREEKVVNLMNIDTKLRARRNIN